MLIPSQSWDIMWRALYDGLFDVITWLSSHYIYYNSSDGINSFKVSYLDVDIALTVIGLSWLALCEFLGASSPSDDDDD